MKIKYTHTLIDLYVNSKHFAEMQKSLSKAEAETENFYQI